MSKFMKIIKIILITLLVIVLGSYVVLYVVNNELAKQIMATVIDYANRPLPIVGVSLLVIAGLIWKIFQATGYGKRAIAKIKAEYEKEKEETRQEHLQKKAEYSAILSTFDCEIDLILEAVNEICRVTPNQKVKAIGERVKTETAVIKTGLKAKIDNIVDSNTETLIRSKEEIVKEVMEMLEKALEEKYGEEGKEALKLISKENKI